ncbi:MAG: hypothetical protein JWM71_1957, partial [Solirubrobacteraceae bacterium]|nr:hypothetical protein [Solirubrobacteraceae bacterium]
MAATDTSQTDSQNEALEAAAGAAGEDAPPFTLELSQDQKDIRDWAHGF